MKPYKNVKVAGRTHSEHKLVWERANGPVPDGYVVHHKNHRKRDNDLSNLELMTYEEHARHHNDKHSRIKTCIVCETEYEPAPTKRARQQTCSRDCFRELASRARGSRKGSAKLDEAKVAVIKARLAAGTRGSVLAAEYGITPATMSAIKTGRTWTHVEPAEVAA